jgi:hypothetical protein
MRCLNVRLLASVTGYLIFRNGFLIGMQPADYITVA